MTRRIVTVQKTNELPFAVCPSESIFRTVSRLRPQTRFNDCVRKNTQVETFLSAEARDCADLEDVFDSEFERMCKGDQMTPQKNTFQIMFSVPRALPSPSLAKTAPPSRRSGRTSSFISVRCEKTTSVERNKNMAQLRAGYLFPEIARIKGEHLKQNPGAEIISLGIGDTTVRRSRFAFISSNRDLYFFFTRPSFRSVSLSLSFVLRVGN